MWRVNLENRPIQEEAYLKNSSKSLPIDEFCGRFIKSEIIITALTKEAAKLAGNLARMSGGKLRVVTAYEALPHYLGELNLSEAIAERTGKAQEILDEAIKEIGEIPGV